MLGHLRNALDVGGYETVLLTEKNYLDIWEVHNSNQDYFVLTEGKKVIPHDVLKSMLTLPDGCDPNSKYCVGIKKDGKMISYLEFYDGLSQDNWV